ncbi:unnamed protein product [Rhizophagus irregularis]|nr:unnamed protein product [Rhizophagus irregularis]
MFAGRRRARARGSEEGGAAAADRRPFPPDAAHRHPLAVADPAGAKPQWLRQPGRADHAGTHPHGKRHLSADARRLRPGGARLRAFAGHARLLAILLPAYPGHDANDLDRLHAQAAWMASTFPGRSWLGTRFGGQLGGVLLPRHHRGRPGAVRTAVRTVHFARAQRAARHRRRLRAPAPRRSHPVHLQQVRAHARGAGSGGHQLQAEKRAARQRAGAGHRSGTGPDESRRAGAGHAVDAAARPGTGQPAPRRPVRNAGYSIRRQGDLRHDLRGRHHRRVPDRIARADEHAATHVAAPLLRPGHRSGDRAPGTDPGRHGPPVPAPPAGHGAGRLSERRNEAGAGAHAGRADFPGAGDAGGHPRRRLHAGRGRRVAARHGGLETKRRPRTLLQPHRAGHARARLHAGSITAGAGCAAPWHRGAAGGHHDQYMGFDAGRNRQAPAGGAPGPVAAARHEQRGRRPHRRRARHPPVRQRGRPGPPRPTRSRRLAGAGRRQCAGLAGRQPPRSAVASGSDAGSPSAGASEETPAGQPLHARVHAVRLQGWPARARVRAGHRAPAARHGQGRAVPDARRRDGQCERDRVEVARGAAKEGSAGCAITGRVRHLAAPGGSASPGGQAADGHVVAAGAAQYAQPGFLLARCLPFGIPCVDDRGEGVVMSSASKYAAVKSLPSSLTSSSVNLPSHACRNHWPGVSARFCSGASASAWMSPARSCKAHQATNMPMCVAPASGGKSAGKSPPVCQDASSYFTVLVSENQLEDAGDRQQADDKNGDNDPHQDFHAITPK